MVVFGSTDRASRFDPNSAERFATQPPGIRYGVAGGQWENWVETDESPPDHSENGKVEAAGGNPLSYTQVGCSSSIGRDKVKFLAAEYAHDDPLIRFRPRLCLKALDGAGWMPFLNASLAEKIVAIHIYANGYKLDEVKIPDFQIDRSETHVEFLNQFTSDELADPWVRIRPNIASNFRVRFFEQTPLRLYKSRLTNNSLPLRIQTQK